MDDWITRKRKELGEFDLSSLTAIGWLLFAISIAVPLVIFIKYVNFESGQPGRPPIQKIFGLAMILAMVGLYQGGRFLIERAGLKTYRRKKQAGEKPRGI